MDLTSLQISISVITEVAEQKLTELQNKVSSFSEKATSGLNKAGSEFISIGKKLSVVTAGVGTVLGLAYNKASSFIGTYESAMTVFERKLEGGKEAAEDLYTSLLNVAKGSSYAQEYLVSAGQTLVAMGVNADRTTKYVQTATNAIAGMGGSGAEIQEMSELFGKISQQTNLYTQDIQQMVTRGIPAWDILATKYKTTTDAVKKMASDGLLPASESLDTITDALNESDKASEMYKYSIEGLAQSLKTGTLTGTLDSLNTSLRTFSLRLLNLDPTTESGKQNIEKLNKAISKFGETMEKIGAKFSFVGDWVSGGLEAITNSLDSFNSMLENLPEWAVKAITGFIGALSVAGPTFIAVGLALKTVSSAIQGFTIVTQLASAALTFFTSPIGLVIAGIALLVSGFIWLWNNCEGFRNFWIGLWDGIVKICTSAVDLVVNTFNTVVNWVKSNWQGLLLLLVNPFYGAFKLIYDNCEGFRNFINNFVGKIKDTFWNLSNGMFEIGKNLIQGLWNGINSMVDWIKSKIQGFGESVLNGLKSFFGIASPSKLMRDQVGKFIAQGIGVGFSNEIDNVEKSMVGEMENLTNSLSVGEIAYNASVSGKTNAGLVNGLTTALQLNSGNQDINLVVDGKTLATVIYNPLNKLTQQKGVNAYA